MGFFSSLMTGGQSRKSTGKVVTLNQANGKIDLLVTTIKNGGLISHTLKAGRISCAYYADMPAEQLLQAVDDMRPDLRLRETKHLGNGFLDISAGSYCLCMLVQSLNDERWERSAVVISLADDVSANPNLSSNDIRILNKVMQTLRPVCEEPERGASGTSYPQITKTMFPSPPFEGMRLPQDLATILEHGTAVSPWDVPGFEHTRGWLGASEEDGIYPAAYFRATQGWSSQRDIGVFTCFIDNLMFRVGPCCWPVTYGKWIPRNELVIGLLLTKINMNLTDDQLKPFIAIAQSGAYSLSRISPGEWILYSPIPRNATKDELDRQCRDLAALTGL